MDSNWDTGILGKGESNKVTLGVPGTNGNRSSIHGLEPSLELGVDDGLSEGLQRFLRNVVPDAAGEGSEDVLAGDG